MGEKKDIDHMRIETPEGEFVELDGLIELDEEEIEEIEEGVVIDCVNLNIRKEPNLNSVVLCTVPVSTKLLIDMSKSTLTWLYVYTETGIEGFCMKQYVGIK